MSKAPWQRCEGSTQVQHLDWLPDASYPGAVVCSTCSYGVLVRGCFKDEDGFWAGRVRAHYVRSDGSAMRYRSTGST